MQIIEMSLDEFVKKYPWVKLPNELDKTDPEYIVRFTADLSRVEVGYLSDSWYLQTNTGDAS